MFCIGPVEPVGCPVIVGSVVSEEPRRCSPRVYSPRSGSPLAAAVGNATKGTEPPLRGLSFGPADRARSRELLLIRSFGLLGILLLFAAVCFKYAVDVLHVIIGFGREMQGRRDDADIIVVCLLVSTIWSALPIPGGGLWKLLVGFVYGYLGFAFLMAGHIVGSLLAFWCARVAWRFRLAQWTGDCALCSKRCHSREGRPNKFMLILLGSRRLVEERPFRMILLLGLAPVPWPLTSYVLGAKAEKLRTREFIVPMSLCGVKMMQNVYAGARVSDIELLLKTGDSSLGVIVSIISVLLGLILVAMIAWFALRTVKQDVARAEEAEAAAAAAAELSEFSKGGDSSEASREASIHTSEPPPTVVVKVTG